MLDIQLIDSLKVIVFQIIEPFLPHFELNLDKSQLLIDSVNKIYDLQLSNLSESEIQKLKNFISQKSFMDSYISIFKLSFAKIFEDKKVNNDDIVHIVELVKNIIMEINKSNKDNNSTISIDVSTIMILVKYILFTVVSIVYKNKEIINIINSIFTLVEISLLPISSNSCKWKCL